MVQFVRHEAPWNRAQVAALRDWQSGQWHPYTCGSARHDDLSGPRPALIPDVQGWTCPDPDCDYRQRWALFLVAGEDA